jgi:hypothetical protein
MKRTECVIEDDKWVWARLGRIGFDEWLRSQAAA